MGSRALTAAKEGVPIGEFVSRVVPSELLQVVSSRRNPSREDLAVVVESITAVVMGTDTDLPEPGVRVWHDGSVARKTYNYMYASGAMLEDTDDVGDPVSVLKPKQPRRSAPPEDSPGDGPAQGSALSRLPGKAWEVRPCRRTPHRTPPGRA